MAFYIQKGGEKRIIIDHDSVVSTTTGINNDTYGTTNTFSDELGKSLKYFNLSGATGYTDRATHPGDMVVKNGQILKGDYLYNSEQGQAFTFDYEGNAVRVIDGSTVSGAQIDQGTENGSWFGYAVDMADGFLVISAPYANPINTANWGYQYGAVHLYDHRVQTSGISTPLKTTFANNIESAYAQDDLGWGWRAKYNSGSVYVSTENAAAGTPTLDFNKKGPLDKLNMDPSGLSSNWFTRQEVLYAGNEVGNAVFGNTFAAANDFTKHPIDEGRIFVTFGSTGSDFSNTVASAAWSHNALGLNNFTSKTYGATAGEHHQHIFISPPEFWPAENYNQTFAKLAVYNHTVYGYYEFERGQGDTGAGSTYATTLAEWDRADGAFPIQDSGGLIALDMDSGEFKGFVDARLNQQYGFGGVIPYVGDNMAFGCGYFAIFIGSAATEGYPVAIYRAGSREFVGTLFIANNQTNAESYAAQDPRYGMYIFSCQNIRIADGYLWLNCAVRTNADSYAVTKAHMLRYTLPPSLEMDIEIASEGDRYLVDWDKGYGTTL